MESTDSSTGSPPQSQPHLPPGFRFHPTDEELVVHYLKKKAAEAPLPVTIIAEVDLYKFDPWELPAKAIFGEQEWYFFSPRDRKYPNGARPNRAATSGYWKATGTDKPVLTAGGTQKVGVKKALVFYGGKPPKGIKTNWIMHEYRLADNKPSKPPGCDFFNKKGSLRLDDWVLCRIYKKNISQRVLDQERDDISDLMMGGSIPPTISLPHNDQNVLDGMMMSHDQMNLFCSKPIPIIPLMTNNLVPTKRMIPNLFWNNEDGNEINPSSTKRLLSSDQSQTTSSIATMLGQFPQTPQNMGIFGDNVLGQQSYHGMNWYS